MKPEVYELCRSGLAAVLRMGYDLMLAHLESKHSRTSPVVTNLKQRYEDSLGVYTTMVPPYYRS
jgi:hypothetical protein